MRRIDWPARIASAFLVAAIAYLVIVLASRQQRYGPTSTDGATTYASTTLDARP